MEEQDQTEGRLHREHRESARRLALLRTKLQQMAADLDSGASGLRGLFDPARTEPAAFARAAIAALPTKETLLPMVEEFRLEQEHFYRLQRQKSDLT